MNDLTRVIADWHERMWPAVPDYRVGCKLAEETGEVCGALVKREEGRKTDEDVMDELGDVLIVVSTLADRLGTTTTELLERRWAFIQARPTTPLVKEG